MDLPVISFAGFAGCALAALVVCFALNVTYNLHFHPLAKFPGPLLHRATRWPYVYKLTRGTLPRDMLAIHRKYGQVVRIAPNELAFSHPEAWKDIYGHKAEELPKYDNFYRTKGIAPSIIAESHYNHALLRRQLAHGFSERSMREQEPIIGSYIDLLIRRLREYVVDPNRKDERTGLQAKRPLDMVSWYTWTTFDVIGDLAFGEPFGCLDKVKDDPWVKAIFDTLKGSAFLAAIKYLGFQFLITPVLKFLMKSRKVHNKKTKDKLERRMAAKVERPDLIEGLLKKKDEWNMDSGRLLINASTLIVAGSETTATLLSGVTYLLLKNPDTLKRVTEEVRSTFKSEEEITLTSVNSLSYMLACLNEGLRRYPPVAFGLPRIVPKGSGGVTIAGEFVPENTVVSVWQWATNHSEENFTDPFGYHPERFMQDPKFARDRLDALQPFSVGPRNCIGRNLAYAEMRLILARIVYNFDMHLVDAGEDWLDQEVYILWAKRKLNVYLTPVR